MKSSVDINLRIPGPTPLPSDVLTATSQQMINHRDMNMKQCMQELLKIPSIFSRQKMIYFF